MLYRRVTPKTNLYRKIQTDPKLYLYRRVQRECIPVDEWKPTILDMHFRHVKGALVLDVCSHYGLTDNPQFNYFILTAKRCYNNDEMREHMCRYMNYFERYYDQEHELLATYYQLKYLIDYEESYNEDAFLYDINRYIIHGKIGHRIRMMNNDNYNLNLSYRNIKNPGLQYTDKHGKILMELSLFQNMIIPLLTHFISVKKIKTVKFFLLKAYQLIIDQYTNVDIVNKLYETALSTISKNAEAHKTLWNMQNIRAKNVTTHAIQTVSNILLQISPKYTYDKNIVHFNYKSLQKSTSYQVIDISYEYNLKLVSSFKRDEDNNSELDKYEAHLIKQDEALYIQNKANCETTMEYIEKLYGPFSDAEIAFYERELTSGGKKLIVDHQKTMVFNLFYKYFGDTRSINSINARDYVKLIIAAKRMLLANNMKLLPYLISGKTTRLVNRVSINKKELTKIEASPYFKLIIDKYRNPKILKTIYAMIATLLSSKFQFVDYGYQMEYESRLKAARQCYTSPNLLQMLDDENINGKAIDTIPEFICEEVLMYTLLI